MQTYDVRFGDVLIQMPWWWLDGLLIWLGLMGVILFLFGRRLVRPMFAVVGLVFGGLVGLAVVSGWLTDWESTPFIMIGAVIGGVVCFALYRLGMGVVLALVVGLAAPLGMMYAQGQPGPPIEQPAVETYHAVAEQITPTAGNVEEGAQTDESGGQNALALTPESLTQPIAEGFGKVQTTLAEWWDGLAVRTRVLLISLAGGAGTLGLVLGILFPALSAALATALIGSLLMIGGAARLSETYLTMNLMPATFRGTLALILIATLIGALFQWTILRPRTDK